MNLAYKEVANELVTCYFLITRSNPWCLISFIITRYYLFTCMGCFFFYKTIVHSSVVFTLSLLLGMEHFTVNYLFSTVTCSGCILHSSLYGKWLMCITWIIQFFFGPDVSLKTSWKCGLTFCLSVWFSANAKLYTNVILNLIPRSDLPKWAPRHPHIFPNRGLELYQKVNVTSGYSILII